MLDLAADRACPGEPLASGGPGGSGGQVIGLLVQQARELAAEIVDGLLGGLYPQRRQDEAAEQAHTGPDQRLENPAGGGGPGAQRQDQLGADRYLQDVNPKAQQVSDGQANGDHDHQAPPREPEGSRSDRCKGCGGALVLTRLRRQPMADDHVGDCKEYGLARNVTKFATELAHAASGLGDAATSPILRSWRRYCEEAAHDLHAAARAESVSTALKKHEKRYEDDASVNDTDADRGRAAAAHMLMLACQALSQGKQPTPVTPDTSMNQERQPDRSWPRRLLRRRRTPGA